MLHVPAGSSPYAVITGIDPGSNTVGIASIKFDIVSLEIISTDAYTVVCEKLDRSEWIAELYGERYSRIGALTDYLTRHFRRVDPLFIAVESPFINLIRPAAYGVLMEVMAGIRASVMNHDQWKTTELIDPSSVKNAVGAKGNAKKEAVKEALSKLDCLRVTTPFDLLDEHSIDAIAVAYARYKRLL